MATKRKKAVRAESAKYASAASRISSLYRTLERVRDPAKRDAIARKLVHLIFGV